MLIIICSFAVYRRSSTFICHRQCMVVLCRKCSATGIHCNDLLDLQFQGKLMYFICSVTVAVSATAGT